MEEWTHTERMIDRLITLKVDADTIYYTLNGDYIDGNYIAVMSSWIKNCELLERFIGHKLKTSKR